MSNSSFIQANILNKTTSETIVLNEYSNLTFPLPLTDLENDNKKRDEYYKSNPLRNYAPTKGQTILPHSLNSSRKKRLPSAFKDLRNKDSNQQDGNSNNNNPSSSNNNNINNIPSSSSGSKNNTNPETMTHKYKLKADLKVNLFYTEDFSKKNLIDLRENTRKVYNEYCHKNITKPVNIRNVQASLKTSNVNTSSNNNTINSHNTSVCNATNQNVLASESMSINQGQNDSISNNNSVPPPPLPSMPTLPSIPNTAPNIPPNTTANIIKVTNNAEKETAPFIEVKRVQINSLEDMVDEIKNKNKLKNSKIIYDNYDNQNLKYTYKEQHQIKLGDYLESSQNQFIPNNQVDSFLNNVHYEIDELELMPSTAPITSMGHLYKRVSKKSASGENDIDQEIELLKLRKQTQSQPQVKNIPRSANTANYYPSKFSVLSHLATSHTILKTDDISVHNEMNESRKDYFMHQQSSRASKQQQRIKEARGKIESQNEKTNLNKLTIIQPFEDTKILINLNQIPSKALNTLFNCNSDQVQQPSYFIPPVKAFGFYTSKTSADNSSNYVISNSHQKNSAHPTTPPPTAGKKRSLRAKPKRDNEANNKDQEQSNNKKNSTSENDKQTKDNSTTTASFVTQRFFNKEFHLKSKFGKLSKSNSSNVIYTQ